MATKKETVEKKITPKFEAKEGEVRTYKSYYHLHRKTADGKDLVFRKSFQKGWYGFEVKENELTITQRESWTKDGHEMPPFSQTELEEFRALTDEQLLEIVNKA